MSKENIKELALSQIDPHYFLDYSWFAGEIRFYNAKELERIFKEDPNPIHRKFHSISIYKEEYAAYEDAGAFIKAFCDYRIGKTEYPIASLLEYKPQDVVLSKQFKTMGMTSSDDLRKTLNLTEWIPKKWGKWYPRLDVSKTLNLACQFFFEDCATNQKSNNIKAYNKIKHGPLVVPSGRLYFPDLPDDSPAMIFSTDGKDPSSETMPITVSFSSSDDGVLKERYRVIEFIQCNLRLISALYVSHRYPRVLQQRGFSSQKELFDSKYFRGVLDFIGKVTVEV